MKNVRARALRLATSALAKTWQVQTRGAEYYTTLCEDRTPFIYALWHSEILPLLWYHRSSGAVLLVSGHGDGGLLADAAALWGFGAVRGSSTRGGALALRGAVRALASGKRVAITPDGPRGPARELKPGIVKLAELSGSPILPVTARVNGGWRLRSWDRFIVPAPMARIEIEYMPPIHVGRGSSRSAQAELTAALNRANPF